MNLVEILLSIPPKNKKKSLCGILLEVELGERCKEVTGTSSAATQTGPIAFDA